MSKSENAEHRVLLSMALLISGLRTADLGGDATTEDATEAILRNL